MSTGDDLKARLTAYITSRQAEIVTIRSSAEAEISRLQAQIDAAKEAARQWTPEVSALIGFLQAAGIDVSKSGG